jgi:oligoribonuclease NrnB/cAMP/cGMP phosphodiesterase (DHH superfamily)
MPRRRWPDRDFFLPPRWAQERARRFVVETARSGRVVHVSHGDCLDGAGSDVIVRLRHGSDHVATVFTDPAKVAEKLAWIAEAGTREGRSLLISDVSPQVGEREALERVLGTLNEQGWRIEWRDHHAKQWANGMLDAVRRKADYVRIDLDNHECGTSICQQDLLPNDAYAKELASVIRDIDLWIRKDPRSDTLTDALHEMGSRPFVAKMVRDKVVLDQELERAARRHRHALDRDLKAAIARARLVQGKHKVGVVYGDFPGSQACHALREALRTDVEINLKPDGKFSIRSRPELPFCHAVAQQFRGGGHPNASGGHLRIAAHEWLPYWLRGGRARQADALAEAASQAQVPREPR